MLKPFLSFFQKSKHKSGFFQQQKEFALLRVKAFIVGEIIKKSLLPFLPNTWYLTIFQAIPAPYKYAVSRCLLIGITVIFSRISSFNLYIIIPYLPHSVSSSLSSSKIIEEVEKVEVIDKVVEVIPVLTDQNYLITETLGPSLFEAVAAPILEQVPVEVQDHLIQTVGDKLDNLEHVTSTVLEVGTAGVGGIKILTITVIVLVGVIFYRGYKINKLKKAHFVLIDKYNEKVNTLNEQRETSLKKWEYMEDSRLVEVKVIKEFRADLVQILGKIRKKIYYFFYERY